LWPVSQSRAASYGIGHGYDVTIGRGAAPHALAKMVYLLFEHQPNGGFFIQLNLLALWPYSRTATAA
jgi:hypothetical protein